MTRQEILKSIADHPGKPLYLKYGSKEGVMMHVPASKTTLLKNAKALHTVRCTKMVEERRCDSRDADEMIVTFDATTTGDGLASQDMGGGYTLVFQRSTADPTKVRAVVKAPDGSIYARGEVVDEKQAFTSRFQAVSNSRDRTYNTSLGLGPNATQAEQKDALLKMAEKMFGRMPQ